MLLALQTAAHRTPNEGHGAYSLPRGVLELATPASDSKPILRACSRFRLKPSGAVLPRRRCARSEQPPAIALLGHRPQPHLLPPHGATPPPPQSRLRQRAVQRKQELESLTDQLARAAATMHAASPLSAEYEKARLLPRLLPRGLRRRLRALHRHRAGVAAASAEAHRSRGRAAGAPPPVPPPVPQPVPEACASARAHTMQVTKQSAAPAWDARRRPRTDPLGLAMSEVVAHSERAGSSVRRVG